MNYRRVKTPHQSASVHKCWERMKNSMSRIMTDYTSLKQTEEFEELDEVRLSQCNTLGKVEDLFLKCKNFCQRKEN